MPFSQKKYDQVFRGIEIALNSDAVNDWERKFLQDMRSKFSRFGRQTRLSNKQYQRLMQLAGSGTNPTTVVPIEGDSQNYDYHPQRRSRPKHRARRRRTGWVSFLRQSLVAILLIGFLAFQAAERFPEYSGPILQITSVKSISGRVTRVRDGDTIEVAGVPIRFGSLDCAERHTAAGRRATGRMKSLVSGERLVCHLNGRTSYDRKIGSCQMQDGRDLAAIMIREGYCSRYW